MITIKTRFVACLLQLVVSRLHARKHKALSISWQTRIEAPTLRGWKSCLSHRSLCGVVVLVAASLIYTGCAHVATPAPKNLIKPRIYPSAPQGTPVAFGSDSQGGRPRESGVAISQYKGQGSDSSSNLWSDSAKSAAVQKFEAQDEEHQIRAAAHELAKTIGSVEKMKLCYVTKDDEWWATFYVDIGSIIDVKQFIWNRESEKFEPFLVLKRISKSKLTSELKQNSPEQKCTILALP